MHQKMYLVVIYCLFPNALYTFVCFSSDNLSIADLLCKILFSGNSDWAIKKKIEMERRVPVDTLLQYSTSAARQFKPLGLICYLVANKHTLSGFPLCTALCKKCCSLLDPDCVQGLLSCLDKRVSCAKTMLIFIQRIMPLLA